MVYKGFEMMRLLSGFFVLIVFLMMAIHPGRVQICLTPTNNILAEEQHCSGCPSDNHIDLSNCDLDHDLSPSHHGHKHLEIDPILLLPDSHRLTCAIPLLAFANISTWEEAIFIPALQWQDRDDIAPYPDDRKPLRVPLGFLLPILC